MGAKSVGVGMTRKGLGIIADFADRCPFPSTLEGVPVECKKHS
jgi:hypothetical protein